MKRRDFLKLSTIPLASVAPSTGAISRHQGESLTTEKVEEMLCAAIKQLRASNLHATNMPLFLELDSTLYNAWIHIHVERLYGVEDTSRIDWLEANDGLVNYALGGTHVTWTYRDGRVGRAFGSTYRRVIDRAMKYQKLGSRGDINRITILGGED